ncbi:neutral zinc metallopeptidase [Microvirga massiliensis]|uniref:neutral zinc metallopeptidase n=1 Tax=Microvirga massiliensis TaxID=1033741 RepID=UPI00164DE2B2|nr:neutral zinc metallopeptidase [Microvirga massiliensis]
MRQLWSLIGILLTATLLSTCAAAQTYPSPEPPQTPSPPPQDEFGNLAARFLGSTEDVWHRVLPAQANRQYEPPKLVLFSEATRSSCGLVQAAAGPLYCSHDRTIYISPSMFNPLEHVWREFALMYVVARSAGLHVENQLGILPRVQERQQELQAAERSALSLRVELMADCLAGVWASEALPNLKTLPHAALEHGLGAMKALSPNPSSAPDLPHRGNLAVGSPEQRVRWFKTGVESGSIKSCDTFRKAP